MRPTFMWSLAHQEKWHWSAYGDDARGVIVELAELPVLPSRVAR